MNGKCIKCTRNSRMIHVIRNISLIRINRCFEDTIRRERPIGRTMHWNVERLKRPPQEKWQTSPFFTFSRCFISIIFVSLSTFPVVSVSLSVCRWGWNPAGPCVELQSNLTASSVLCLTETRPKYIHISPSHSLSALVTYPWKVFFVCLFVC